MEKLYHRLIKANRQRPSTIGLRPIVTESESDRGRLVFSSPFRRLERKAQVFPLESRTAVRSRLSHSLEVAHIGRYIAQTIIRKFKEKNQLESFGLCDGREVAFVNLVETAGLMHDIGNPPFGHFGEYAIRDWFSHEGLKLLKKAIPDVTQKQLKGFERTLFKDFANFDGNAQGFRIITRLQGNDGLTGLNLTYSQLAAYLKYVVPPSKVSENRLFGKKPGYFHSESKLVQAVWESLGIEEFKRHPLAYVMEAADDIAFRLSDIEDGIEKRIITEELFRKRLLEEWENLDLYDKAYESFIPDIVAECWSKKEDQAIAPLVKFKTKLVNKLVDALAESYMKHHTSLADGEIGPLIQEGTEEHAVLRALRSVVSTNIYSSREAEDIELGGHAVVCGLLSHLGRLLECSRDDFHAIRHYEPKGPTIADVDLERRLFNLLAEKHITSYDKSVEEKVSDLEEWYYRAHLILDYVAGMTDDYALQTFQLLSGIRVE